MISQYPANVGVHEICGIRDKTFFIYHETTYNHVIKESCVFVYGGSVPKAITLSSLVVMNHGKLVI